MAKSKSSVKRARQNRERRARNMSVKSAVKTAVKKVDHAIQSGDREATRQELIQATSMLNKASAKSVIPRRRASRKISRLSRRVSALVKPAEAGL
ncbi:MAG: 30S ribosomal protein S20 [Nitrospinae bacterium]|nr:30S ribosomal protein S20 [Nitrospinota bacterium]